MHRSQSKLVLHKWLRFRYLSVCRLTYNQMWSLLHMWLAEIFALALQMQLDLISSSCLNFADLLSFCWLVAKKLLKKLVVGCQTEERNLISFASGNIYVLCLYNSLTSVASHAVFQFCSKVFLGIQMPRLCNTLSMFMTLGGRSTILP